MILRFFFVLIFVSLVQSSVVQKKEQKNRILNKSDKMHNKDVGHKTFRGKDESKFYDQLPPEERKSILGAIYEKIDKDHDGQLTEVELTEWIHYVQTRYVRVDTDRKWSNFKIEDDDSLSWDMYKDKTYGHHNEDEVRGGQIRSDEARGGQSYQKMMKRDLKRWSKADENNDSMLTKEEFMDFLHPQESQKMRNVIVDETIEDLDKNRDGLLSLEEYLGEMNSEYDDEEEEEQDWLKMETEKEEFHKYRDKNKDGYMDRNEIMDWIIPPDYEAKHLMFKSDVNKDKMLTKQEVLDKFDLFLASQATDFGNAFLKHDEF